MRRNAIKFGLVLLASAFIPGAGATTYYVSSSGGSDSNSGTSPASAWKTFGGAGNHINAGTFSHGDVINLKRDDTWNEQLIPPSSGTSGSPISFDAYGTGAAPLITAAAPIPFVSGSWSYVSGSTWKATISSTISSPAVNLVQFGSVYGRKQPSGGSCSSAIANKYDWCLTWPYLYVYSPSGTNPVTTYATDGSIVPIIGQTAGLQMIYVNGKTWLTFQHINIQTFDYMGVSVAGASDNLVFANMESDGMVPYGATPHGFYVNTTVATNIQFLNDEGLFGGKTGAEKKDAAMSFLQNALAMTDAVSSREIVDPPKFKDGISKIIDGTVECLNSSTWAKSSSQPAVVSPQP
jgi:hypothetical protein